MGTHHMRLFAWQPHLWCFSFASEVTSALEQHAVAQTAQGSIWAYEVNGYGSQLLMDDANVPSLLSLPYLDSSPDAALMLAPGASSGANAILRFPRRCRRGIGGPQEGKDMIWPMAITVYALTSRSEAEIVHAVALLKHASAGSVFCTRALTATMPRNSRGSGSLGLPHYLASL
jgi:meiotically up-regulated gene 157 (Mug157) protein